MIVKIIKSYRDKDLESALLPGSKNNTEVLVNVSDERAEKLKKAGVAEDYVVETSDKEAINVLEAEPTIEVEEVKAEETTEEATEETTKVEESKEEAIVEEPKKNNNKKNNK